MGTKMKEVKSTPGHRTTYSMCDQCKDRDHCKEVSDKALRPCRNCGTIDNCNAKHDGLCFECYARQWCVDHPVEYIVPKVETLATQQDKRQI